MQGGKHINVGILMAAIVILFVAWSDTLQHLATLVWYNDLYSHGVWVPVVSLWLAWRRKDMLSTLPLRFWWPAAPGLVLANLLWLLGGAAEAKITQHIALLTAVQFLVAGCLGIAVYRALLFPMLFLFAVIPPGEQLVGPLQVFTAELVIGALDISGISYEAEGVLIRMSSGIYEVARACAGVKFLFTSLVMGILLCHLAFRSWRRRVAMLVAAVAVPILANAIRVYATLLLAEATDASFAKGVDHIVYGWGFLSFVLLILIAVAYRFTDRTSLSGAAIVPHEAGEAREASPHIAVFSAVLVVAAALLTIASNRWLSAPFYTASHCPVRPVDVPRCVTCDIRHLDARLVAFWLRDPDADAVLPWHYRMKAEPVMGLSLLYNPDRAGARLVKPLGSLLWNGWEILDGQPTARASVAGRIFSEHVIWRHGERRLVWQAYIVGEHQTPSASSAKLRLALMRLQAKRAAGQRIVIVTDLASTIEESRSILAEFFRNLPPDRFVFQTGQTDWENNICAE